MRIGFFSWMVILFCALISVQAAYADIIVPGADASVEGDIANGFPFNGFPSVRYQQVYDASEFGTVPILITGIAFRPDAGGSAFSTTLSNVQINLSTTASTPGPNGMSGTYADNVGPDDTIVRSGSLPLSSAFTGPAGGPKDFDITISFTTPFLYNPALGNLLLDIRNFAGGLTTQFDAANDIDSVARVHSFFTDPNGANSTSGFPDGIGLITLFQTTAVPTAVPEPASFGLVATGLVIGGFIRTRRKRQSLRK